MELSAGEAEEVEDLSWIDLLELENQCVSKKFCLILAGDVELSLCGVLLISKLLSRGEKDCELQILTSPAPPCSVPLSQFLGM